MKYMLTCEFGVEKINTSTYEVFIKNVRRAYFKIWVRFLYIFLITIDKE